ncbi:MAG: lipopolysaccharide kinase InaA family protein [Planctomycetota bacterium]
MRARILLDPALAPALAAAGLTSPDGLFRLGGDALPPNVVTVLELPLEGTSGRFHLKRYHYPDWTRSRGLLGRGTLWGRAPEIREFKTLAAFRENGVPAVRPVAAASLSRRGRLVAHALLTEHVPDAADLQARLSSPDDALRRDASLRRRVLALVGRHLGVLHGADLAHRDCHARNILVRVEEDDPRIWFLDCRRGGTVSWRRGPLFDLATLDADLASLVSATDRLRVLRAWQAEGGDLRRVYPRVRRKARALARKARS